MAIKFCLPPAKESAIASNKKLIPEDYGMGNINTY